MSGGKSSPRPSVADLRAQAQAEARAARAERRAAEELDDAPVAGRGLIVADVVATALFVLTALVAVVAYRPVRDSAVTWPFLAVSVAMFVGGCGLFLVALWAGAQRSRTARMGIAGWFFLAGSAPRAAARPLLGCLAAQVVVGIAAAAARPFTVLAFATLVPVYGLALCGWWSARHGRFEPREVD